MSIREAIVIALCATTLLIGCARKTDAPAIDVAAEAQAVRDRSAEWQRLAHAQDAAGIVNDIYTPDAVSMFEQEIRKGSAELLASEEGRLAPSEQTFGWTTTRVQVAASGDLAYELGDFWFDTDGAGEIPTVSGEYVAIWTKADGTWRVAVDASAARATNDTPAE